MDLQDAADLKSRLKMNLTKLLEEFEQLTKLTVVQIDINRTRHGSEKISGIDVVVEL